MHFNIYLNVGDSWNVTIHSMARDSRTQVRYKQRNLRSVHPSMFNILLNNLYLCAFFLSEIRGFKNNKLLNQTLTNKQSKFKYSNNQINGGRS